jgi:pyruvate,water dikinase
MFRYAIPLREISAELFQEFGGKGANLGELIKAGFNVPAGFCIKSKAYHDLIDSNDLGRQISDIVKAINFNSFKDLDQKSALIRSLIINAQVPEDLEQEIIHNYHQLEALSGKEPLVAVRSSVAVRGTSISSFPGMMDTFHYIRGSDQVLHGIRKCWASVWTGRATFARHQKGIDHSLALIAPVIQEMVDSEVAGVMFTINPMTGSRDEILIESNWGLGESVVSGRVVNDLYFLDKATLSTKTSRIVKKPQMIVHDREKGMGCKEIPVPLQKVQQPTLTDSMLKELGITGLGIEAHYGIPQDIEWAYCGDRLFILQSRTARGCQA